MPSFKMPSFKLGLWFRLMCAAVCCLAASPLLVRAQVPTPISVLGHNPGDDFYLADYEDTVRYFHALAAAARPDEDVHRGQEHARARTLRWRVISSPQNLAKLDEYKADCRAAGARDRPERRSGAMNWRATRKVIVHIDGGLHCG